MEEKKQMKKNIKEENYLERIPVHPEHLSFSHGDDGHVILTVENRGVMKRLTQILLRKPKQSHIHLDELGSFIWERCDGQSSLLQIGESLDEHFGDKAKPTYERLSRFMAMLEQYKFIDWSNR
jgi:hypothetical protein